MPANVIKRSGKIVSFDISKIESAIRKAIEATGDQADDAAISRHAAEASCNLEEVGEYISIEAIQDSVIKVLREHLPRTAEAYAAYRAAHERIREERGETPVIILKYPEGERTLEVGHFKNTCLSYCAGNTDNGGLLFKYAARHIYSGMPGNDLEKAILFGALELIEREPKFSYVAAKMQLHILKGEVGTKLGIHLEEEHQYKNGFCEYIRQAVQAGLLDFSMQTAFNTESLVEAIKPERDEILQYLGVKTLVDRYLLHIDEKRIELPQWLFMRVAMGMALAENRDRTDWAIKFYDIISGLDYMPSTPTLFNAGTRTPQMSSCYVSLVTDSIGGIFGSITDNAQMQKFAGGVANSWSAVRAMGARIKGTNGISSGVVPFLKIANDTAVAVNQSGKRRGAVCAYLEPWHLDIEEFLELRKNTGDERRRTHDMNTACWVSDLFMRRVENNAEWTLFSPDETGDLTDLYGEDFANRYAAYEELAARGEIRKFKKVSAVYLWRKMLTMLFETGHPWITFKDAHNLRNNQYHCGVVHSSNLCTEISLNTGPDEIAVCNLGSVNLSQHVRPDGSFDYERLGATVTLAVRMLDNVVSKNFYPVEEARTSNMRHRPIGLGVMGWSDMLAKIRVPYDSDQAESLSDEITEMFSYYALRASMFLAKERGRYETFEGSLASLGILPIDTALMACPKEQAHALHWETLRCEIMENGLRNSHVMAIAPTATISLICGVSQSIEPYLAHVNVKENLGGRFTVVNPLLVSDLKVLGLWDDEMVNAIKHKDGSIQGIYRIPEEIRDLYKTAWEIPPERLIKCAAMRQKWIDQAQSLNFYVTPGVATGKRLHEIYMLAWRLGLKSTYYLRTKSASQVVKHTVTVPESCSMEQGCCEACQ
jgi:ribonucleoside-diphosphate reductase alpha chain